MKHLSGLVVFVVGFLVSGVVMHQALYGKTGIFVWSWNENPETGEGAIERTKLWPLPVEVVDPNPVSESSEAAVVKDAAQAEKKDEGAQAAAKAEKPAAKEKEEPSGISLLNGKDLGDWKKTQFGGEGDVFLDEKGNLEFGFGAVMTGVHWGGKVPATSNYEIELEAKKLDGYDFFCALTFPVKDSHATYVIGGWGGGIVGISCVDDLNASENETMNIEGFEKDRWYKVKVRVTDAKLEAWLDEDQMVDLELKDRKISLLPGDIELSAPIGIASFQTRAAYRNIFWRNLKAEK